MGSTLTGQKIKDTYLGFIKTSDSLEVNASGKELTDGNGNDLNIFINTSGEIGFGSTPDYTIDAGSSTGAFRLPNGSTAQQPTGQTGLIRYNTTDSKLEYYDSSFKFIASENYVNTQINNLIDSSPAALDTLNEIAAALNDDPDFYNTINTLINTKQDTVTGAATTIVSSDLTVSRALISNASGKVAVSSVTDTELGYVSGVTSDIQTQIDAKYDKSGGTITGNATITGDLTVDTNTLYVDSTNNRVGVGTTSLSEKLNVVGNIDLNGVSSYPLLKIRASGLTSSVFTITQDTANPKFSISDARNFIFESNSVERMRIDSNGNFGFNETPENSSGTWRNFEVGGVNIVSRFSGNNDGFFGTGYVFKTDNSEVYKNTEAVSRLFFNNDIIEFQQAPSGTAGTAISWDVPLKIDSSGRVGIGVTPSTGWSSPNFTVLQLGVGASIAGRGSAGTGDQIYISANTYYDGTTWRYIETNPASNYYQDNGEHVWRTAVNGSAGVPTTLSERMRINNSGNVGIGTTSPDSLLHSYGTGDVAKFETTSLGGVNFSRENAVGNNSTHFVASFNNADSEVAYIKTLNKTGATTSTGTGYELQIASAGSGYQTFYTNGTERMRIDSNGNVGIGTTSPISYSNRTTLAIEDAWGGVLDIMVGGVSHAQFGTDNFSSGLSCRVESKDGIVFKPSNTERMRLYSGGDISFRDGSANEAFYWDASAGSLGINDTAPSFPLTIYGGSGAASYDIFRAYAWNGTSNKRVEIKIDNTETDPIAIWNTSKSGGASVEHSFQIDGSEKMRIDSSGGINFKTLNSSTFVDLTGSAPGASRAFRFIDGGTPTKYNWLVGAQYNIDNTFEITPSTAVGGTTFSSPAVVVKSTGNVGIGVTPSVPLHTKGTSEILRLDSTNGNGNPFMTFYQNGTRRSLIQHIDSGDNLSLVSEYGGIRFSTGTGGTEVERMRITSGGDVLVGTTSDPSASVTGFKVADGTSGTFVNNAKNVTTSTAHFNFFNPNGVVGSISTSGSATAYNTSSDYRLKENVVNMTGALDRVDQLEPKRFNFIADANKTVDGFLAHEVADIVPEAISGEKDEVDDEGNPVYQGIDQSKLVPLLVGAIQELRAEIETLKSQINP